MKYWVVLAWAILAAQLCFITSAPINAHGKAFVTQAGAVAGSQEYEQAFGQNWDSVRTFRLLHPLDKPLKVYIETVPSNPLYKAEYRDFVIQSVTAWADALDHRIKFELTDRRLGADITVHWVRGFDDPYVAGITNYRVGHADVNIKTAGIPTQDIRANILHEFGHAFGIAGHSPSQNDIMVATRRWHRDDGSYHPQLSKHDVQAIRHLYSADWHRGEDLYAIAAQRNVIVYNHTDDSKTAATLQPIESLVVNLNEPAAQAPQTIPVSH